MSQCRGRMTLQKVQDFSAFREILNFLALGEALEALHAICSKSPEKFEY